MTTAVMWFRRDLRLADNPALLAAAARGSPVVGLFVLDDRLCRPAGANRLAFLYRALRSLDTRLGGRLVIRHGDPTEVVPAVAAEAGADRVVCAADFGPYGRRRDEAVAIRLAGQGRRLDRVGSPYAVAPGTVLKGDGTPYQVFTAFHRVWATHLTPEPLPRAEVAWLPLAGGVVPADPAITAKLPEATEATAHRRLDQFADDGLGGYRQGRDVPADDGTSRLSPYLKLGLLHPNQILVRVGEGGRGGTERFRTELAWREFYADVVWHDPGSARRAWRPAMQAFRSDRGPVADRLFVAWAAGRTGFPLVDAGMRQLAATGWMHNRVRMITASFLVKDLHLPWERGARHFMAQLIDGDIASNNHGWQWVAGCGTDAAPFFRIFNPVAQSRRWDPRGDYIRRFVPELVGVASPAVHQPWLLPGGPPPGYPAPVVEHAVEREEALARYREAISGARASAQAVRPAR
jgi:deoxyribodipyrimidine photo-lyase